MRISLGNMAISLYLFTISSLKISFKLVLLFTVYISHLFQYIQRHAQPTSDELQLGTTQTHSYYTFFLVFRFLSIFPLLYLSTFSLLGVLAGVECGGSL